MTETTSPGSLDDPAPDGLLPVVGVGSVQGLGAAIARRFGRAGYPVVIAGRSAGKLRADGITVQGVLGDASKAEDARRFVAEAAKLGPLSIAVHNAGSNRPSPFLKLSEAEFEAHWREHSRIEVRRPDEVCKAP